MLLDQIYERNYKISTRGLQDLTRYEWTFQKMYTAAFQMFLVTSGNSKLNYEQVLAASYICR